MFYCVIVIMRLQNSVTEKFDHILSMNRTLVHLYEFSDNNSVSRLFVCSFGNHFSPFEHGRKNVTEGNFSLSCLYGAN